MKTLIAAAFLALSLGTVASANSTNFVLQGYGVDTSKLSRSTINTLKLIIHGYGSESDKRLAVRSILKRAHK
ncbi:MAG: hypothetical protein AAF748_16395 [Pseudomonadota bacterium]